MPSFRPAGPVISHDFPLSPRIAFLRITFGAALFAIFVYSAAPCVNGQTVRTPAVNTKSRPEPDLSGKVINPTNVHRLHVSCDFGNILIHTTDSGDVEYRVFLKANASEEKAKTRLLKGYRLSARSASDGI